MKRVCRPQFKAFASENIREVWSSWISNVKGLWIIHYYRGDDRSSKN